MMKLRMGLGAVVLVAACYSGLDASAVLDADDGNEPDDADNVERCLDENGVFTGRAPLRRLTRFEYNNTVRDLLGDETSPANALPSEEIGNGFGNDADAQAVSSLLAEQYAAVGEEVALRATSSPASLGRLAACAADVHEGTDLTTENACARALIEDFATRAYRRPLEPGEADELFALQQSIREASTFATSIAAVIEAVLQSPDFLYRVEWGIIDPEGRRRPSGYEMATRLSYFLWGSLPDDELLAAAESGDLTNDAGVLEQAARMLDDPRSRPVVRFFFDHLLPISGLADLERDPSRYPAYSPALGALMREETHRFLEYEIFEGSGTWPGILTADYTFANEALAQFYGIPGVQGDEFQKVPIDTTQRLGLLTQAGLVAGPIHSNETNPVVRGAFIVQKIMCMTIPLPTADDVVDDVTPPDPDSGATARERFSRHSEDPTCRGCHQLMDPVGFPLESYDPVGLWRDTENGVTLDLSGSVPGAEGTIDGPVELVAKIAEQPQTHACFAKHWSSFAYGRTLGVDDQCTSSLIEDRFEASGYDVFELLLGLTQTDDFLYLPQGGE
jgi:hypothetical protein